MNSILQISRWAIALTAFSAGPTLHAQAGARSSVADAGEASRAMEKQQIAGIPIQVFPTPQEAYLKGKPIGLGPVSGYTFALEAVGSASSLTLFRAELDKRLQARFGGRAGTAQGPKILFALSAQDLPVEAERIGRHLDTIEDREGYVMTPARAGSAEYVLVAGKSEAALWRAFSSLVQLIEEKDGQLSFPGVELIDYPHMKQRGLLVDMGGQGFMVGQSRWEFDQWKEFVDWMVDQKLNELWLEFIGGATLMGTLDIKKGEWIGFPLELKSYPQMVCRDRPIKRWDSALGKVVEDKYTAPNVRQEFVRELIDYAQARGIKCVLMIGYDYFANQISLFLGVPHNDPSHREANKVYDTLLQEIVERYSNAQGVTLITMENAQVPPSMVDEVARRAGEGRTIVKKINPKMDVGLLNDYLEKRPHEEFERYAQLMPTDVYQLYSPHTSPQDKSWKRLYGDVYRYEFCSQYAWNHIAYIFPERMQREVVRSYCNGYRKILTQAWLADVFLLNFTAFAESAWNTTGTPLPEFWDATLTRVFGAAAKDDMRTALAHTRFDRRADIIARMILGNYVDRPFRFWDMYVLTMNRGLSEEMLEELRVDAEVSLRAARAAEPKVAGKQGREMLEVVMTSAERRLYLATSAKHWLKAVRALKAGDKATAATAIEACLVEAGKLEQAAVKLGIEYPMGILDDDVIARYRETAAKIKSN
jgi:hypothetical protein